jgi:hypothetical protein
MTAVIIMAAALAAAPSAAHGQDFFSALFGGFQPPRQSAPALSLPFAVEGEHAARPQARSHGGGSLAYCVRTCDGRYFPVSGPDNASRVASCNSLCPASETKVFYGGTIDNASSGGRSYSDLPNAFRYRTELIKGCTCNGKDQFGLAKVEIDDDPTLRKGDIVAGADGLMVARRVDRRRGDLELSPAESSVRSRYAAPRLVAAE